MSLHFEVGGAKLMSTVLTRESSLLMPGIGMAIAATLISEEYLDPVFRGTGKCKGSFHSLWPRKREAGLQGTDVASNMLSANHNLAEKTCRQVAHYITSKITIITIEALQKCQFSLDFWKATCFFRAVPCDTISMKPCSWCISTRNSGQWDILNAWHSQLRWVTGFLLKMLETFYATCAALWERKAGRSDLILSEPPLQCAIIILQSMCALIVSSRLPKQDDRDMMDSPPVAKNSRSYVSVLSVTNMVPMKTLGLL